MSLQISSSQILRWRDSEMAFPSRNIPLFLIFPIILLHFPDITESQPPEFIAHVCINSANYTRNSPYRSNLNSALSSLPSNTATNFGFNTTSIGQNPSNTVNALALCRGDVSQQTCQTCVNDSTVRIVQDCPNQMQAVGWYDYCMVRYWNATVFNRVRDPYYLLSNTNNASSPREFNDALSNLMDRLNGEAAAGSAVRKFATGNISGPDFFRIYGLMQCSPDLSEADCRKCLEDATAQIPVCCSGKLGGQVIGPSCLLRFEVSRFYNETPVNPVPQPPPPPSGSPPPAPAASPPPPPGKSNNTARTIILITVPSVGVVVLVALICIFMRQRKRKQGMPEEQTETGDDISTIESLQYKFSTISAATGDFSEKNKLGQGGFGPVYKGRLQNGLEIAVKRLSVNSGQGEQEFKNEILLVARLQHRNLVRLLGFCLEGPERLLIYEFIHNASLDQFLFDPVKRANLDWDRRFKIIEGVARGLLYLHEDSRLRIIHRDLKPSNVLLDAEMNAKIADFGLARLFNPEETQGNTSRIAGTYGYMSPEYAMRGQFSVKSDVYSFGILLLEIVTGQKNQCFQIGEKAQDLISYAWKSWKEGTALNMIDSMLKASPGGSMRDMMRTIHIGLLCVQENVADRPTMGSIVVMLSSMSITLPMPLEPAFFSHSTINPEMPLLEFSCGTSDSGQSRIKSTSSHWSVNDASITDLDPR